MASSVPSEEADPHKMETTPIVPDVPLENDAVSQNLVRIAISFTAQSEGELTVTEGDLVAVTSDPQDGFVYCTNMETSESGLLPAECLEAVGSPRSHRRRGQVVDKAERPSPSPDLKRRARVQTNEDDEETDGRPQAQSTVPAAAAAAAAVVEDAKPDFSAIERHRIVSVGGTDREGRPVIVSSACRLPPSHDIDHSQLLEYLKSTLDRYVESDYTLVYFHFGLNSSNKPGMRWLISAYREFDRKYKKNLKKLYIVHPSTFIKIIMGIFRPFISVKFGRKVSYVNRLSQLSDTVYLDQLDIPDPIREHDAALCAKDKPKPSAHSKSTFHAPLSEGVPVTQQFGVSLSWLKEHSGGDDIPKAVQLSVEYIRANALDVQGIFRRAASTATVKEIKQRMNKGENLNFGSFFDPQIPCVILKTFLRELPEPLLTYALYEPMMLLRDLSSDEYVTAVKKLLDECLPPQNYTILKYIMHFLTEVASHSAENKMDEPNLAIVFGPNLLWSSNEAASLLAMGHINTFTKILISRYSDLFES